MREFYVIQWKSLVNGRSGKGTKQFSLDEAERLAEELNREYPDIVHEVVLADAQGEMPPLAPVLESSEQRDSAAEPADPARDANHVLSFR